FLFFSHILYLKIFYLFCKCCISNANVGGSLKNQKSKGEKKLDTSEKEYKEKQKIIKREFF
ncbi:MAG: hypothetical protein COU27_01175, partial [Candidatus Levybacteria bacterium CG10_big_fil_rev_8_21_14_0_10_36_7]